MSEKHLTEPPWKSLVAKHGVKDIGLSKAFLGYAKVDAAKEPEKGLDILDQISQLATKLKKANPTKEEVLVHLEEVLKEVKKTRPSLEASVKSADSQTKSPAAPASTEEDPAEEQETQAFKKDFKKQLISTLAQVKSRAPGDSEEPDEMKPQLRFMAYLAGANCAVIVARKVGTETRKLLSDIAGVAGGGQFLTGDCVFENNAHTFVLEKVPPGMAKKLCAALYAQTAIKYRVRARSCDGSTSLDSDTDVDADIPQSALTAWRDARATAIAQLRVLGTAIKAAQDPEADQALIILEAVCKNLTENPVGAAKLQELERYLQTDEVVAQAESPNPFDVAINLRAPLLAALASLKSQPAPAG
jgi:hypothetical protein